MMFDARICCFVLVELDWIGLDRTGAWNLLLLICLLLLIIYGIGFVLRD